MLMSTMSGAGPLSSRLAELGTDYRYAHPRHGSGSPDAPRPSLTVTGGGIRPLRDPDAGTTTSENERR